MSAAVLDACALVEHVLWTDVGRRLAALVHAPDADLHVPSVCDVEVGATLRRLTLRGEVAADVAAAALRDHRDLPITRHPHRVFLDHAFALRENFGFADAMYVTLAEAFGMPLVTADAALARAVRRHTGVEVLTG